MASIDFTNLAKSSIGGSELKLSLYDSGLQNIFDDYMKQVDILNAEEKQAIDDAYVSRKIEEKYLGEYASNTGIGNVDGNLIDIYSNYQDNIQEISDNKDELQLNLQSEYDTAKKEAFNNILQTQYDIEVEKLDENAQNIIHNIAVGNTGDMTNFEYLESVKDQMSTTDYNSVYETLYSSTLDEVSNGLTSGNYGYSTDENGNKTLITSPIDYINKYKDVLSNKDYNSLVDQINYSSETTASVNQVTDYNVMYNFSDTNGLSENSKVFKFGDSEENYYAEIDNNVDLDTNAPQPVDSDTLNTYYEENYNGTLNEQTVMVYRGTYYMFESGAWHRMVSHNVATTTSNYEEMQKSWHVDNGTKTKTSVSGYSTNGERSDTLEVSGSTYKEDRSTRFGIMDTGDVNYDADLVEYFKEIHGDGNDGIKKNSVVYYNGKFYVYNKRGISEMSRQ